MPQQTEEALAVYQSTPWLQTLWEHWQRGEWEALRAWDLPELELHPQRGWALALIAMAYQEIGPWECAREKLQQAENWGVPSTWITKLVMDDKTVDLTHTDTKKTSILGYRSSHHLLNQELQDLWVLGEWNSLSKLDNTDLLQQKNPAEAALYAACGYQQLDDLEGLQRCVDFALKEGLPKEKIKLFLRSGLLNSLAIANVLSNQFEAAANDFTKSIVSVDAQSDRQSIEKRIENELIRLFSDDWEEKYQFVMQHLSLNS